MLEEFQKEILIELKKHSGYETKHSGSATYLGNTHFSYHVSNPAKRGIVRAFIKRHKDLSLKEFANLLNTLYKAKSHDEKSLAGMFLQYLWKYRQSIKPMILDNWLDHLEGWAEVDSLCQSNFTADDILSNWKEWKRALTKLSKDKNINKRRASLVLLTWPVYKSADPRLSKLAFRNIDRLKREKDILVTKAISWLLRNLITNHRKEVISYLKKNDDSLPKIAIRETRRKLLTGRK